MKNKCDPNNITCMMHVKGIAVSVKLKTKEREALGTARDDGIGERRELRNGFWRIESGGGGGVLAAISTSIGLAAVAAAEKGFQRLLMAFRQETIQHSQFHILHIILFSSPTNFASGSNLHPILPSFCIFCFVLF